MSTRDSDERSPGSEQIALTAIYLALGFEQAHRDDPDPAAAKYDDWSESCQGQTGIMRHLIWYAELIEQWLLDTKRDEYPGVFHYEIVEPLGAWMYSAADLAEGIFTAELSRLWDIWMKENGL